MDRLNGFFWPACGFKKRAGFVLWFSGLGLLGLE